MGQPLSKQLYNISLIVRVLSCLEMHHIRFLGVEMDNYAKWFVKDANFGSPSDLYLCLPHIDFYEIGQGL